MGSLNPESPPKQEMDDSGYVQEDTAAKESRMAEGDKSSPNLLDLSDDVLLYILQYCSPIDLKALGYTCSRLGTLVLDRTLWQCVDARATPTGRQRMRWLLTHALCAHTTTLRLSGYAREARGCLGYMSGSRDEPPLQASPFSPMSEDQVPLHMFDTETVHQEGPRLFSLSTHALPRYGGLPYWPEQSETRSNRPAPAAETGTTCIGPQVTLTNAALTRLTELCKNLTELALEYVVIDCDMTKVNMFPASLRILSLKGTKCFNLKKLFLYKINDHLVHLEDLDVSYCEWVEPSCMLPLSKLPRLSRLIMQHCTKLTEFVAYASLATRYGFKALKILDLRGSPVGDSEVSALGWVPLLEQVYLSPASGSRHADHAHFTRDTRDKYTELMPWEEGILDLRGSPVGDSEVSALGWVPLLEQVYLSPASGSRHADHAHFTRDTRDKYTELMPWEEGEPEYYRSKYATEQWILDEAQPRPKETRHGEDCAFRSCMLLRHVGDVDLSRSEEERPSRHPCQSPPQALPTMETGRPRSSTGAIQPNVSKRTVNDEKDENASSSSSDLQNNENSQKNNDENDGNSLSYLSARNKKFEAMGQKWYQFMCDNIENDSNDSNSSKNTQNNESSPVKRPKNDEKQGQSEAKQCKKQNDQETVAMKMKRHNDVNDECGDASKPGCSKRIHEENNVNNKNEVKQDKSCEKKFKNEVEEEVFDKESKPICANRNFKGESQDNLLINKKVLRDTIIEIACNKRKKQDQESTTNSSKFENEVKKDNKLASNNEVSSSMNECFLNEADSSKSKASFNNTSSKSMNEVTSSNEAYKKYEVCSTSDHYFSKNEAGSSKSFTISSSEASTSKVEASTSKTKAVTSKTETATSSKDINSSNEGHSVCDTSNKELCNIIKSPKDFYTKASRKHYDDGLKGSKVEKESLSDFKKRLLSSGHKNIDSTKSPEKKDDNSDDDQPQSKRCRVVDDASTSNEVISSSKKTSDSSNSGPSDPGPSHPAPSHPAPSDPGPSTSNSGQQPQRFVRFTRNRPPVVVEGCDNHTDDNHNVHNNNDVQQPDWNSLLADSQSNNRPSSSNNPTNNSTNNQPEAEQSRHKILYVNVGRRRHAMYQISMQEPVDLRTQRPLTAAMNLLYSSHSAPRLEYTSLVTDSAIRRFGRADGENINYVQIGPMGIAPAPYDDPHARPNRSNLRILSVTGFRHVTNYSLTHLATAAPHLQLIDFTGTRVTESGVQHFRNIRPDCRVRYGPIDTPKEDNGRPHSR